VAVLINLNIPSSAFLDLPREIRDQVYAYILTSPTQTVTLSWHQATVDEYKWILPKSRLKIIPFDAQAQWVREATE
jgi:hypothetical protein